MGRVTSIDQRATAEMSRLSVNLTGDTMAALKELADRRGSTVSETIRRAIAVLKYFDDQVERGSEIAVIEDMGDGKTQVNKVILLG